MSALWRIFLMRFWRSLSGILACLPQKKGGSKAKLFKISRKADRIAPSALSGALPLRPRFEGNIGLSKAIGKFDLSNDVKFVTYAMFWVRSQILDAIEKNKSKIDNEDLNNLDVRINEKSLYDESDDMVMLSESIYSNADDINDDEVEKENKEYVAKLMKKLTIREKFVVEQYFGIGCKSNHTLNEIGKKLKLSSERIRKIKLDAMKKLRTEAMINSIC